jgi:hypothetical protein
VDVINKDNICRYLESREKQGCCTDLEGSFFDRIIYTRNGVAKLRGERNDVDESADYLLEKARRARKVRDYFGVDQINTTETILPDYRGQRAFVVFQPYTDAADRGDDDRITKVMDRVRERELVIDSCYDNFGIQKSSGSNDEIYFGFRDTHELPATYKQSIAKEHGIILLRDEFNVTEGTVALMPNDPDHPYS